MVVDVVMIPILLDVLVVMIPILLVVLVVMIPILLDVLVLMIPILLDQMVVDVIDANIHSCLLSSPLLAICLTGKAPYCPGQDS